MEEAAMKQTGVLEAMARADLDAVLTALGERYRPGALEALVASEPGWGEAVERAEREVGGLYEALREADRLLLRWRRALAELYHLWARVGEVRPADVGPAPDPALEPVLDEVA
jgi:hypothetical protein